MLVGFILFLQDFVERLSHMLVGIYSTENNIMDVIKDFHIEKTQEERKQWISYIFVLFRIRTCARKLSGTWLVTRYMFGASHKYCLCTCQTRQNLYQV